MRSFRVLIDAKVWTLRERHDPAQPSCSAYLAAHGRVRGTVATPDASVATEKGSATARFIILEGWFLGWLRPAAFSKIIDFTGAP